MKQSKWPVAQFVDILERLERKIILDDAETYDCVGVRWYGKGAFIRESKLGMDIRRKKQWIIEEGDVVYNKLFAWRGAFAVAHAEVDGCIVSDKFPTYRLDEGLVDSRYLRYYFCTDSIAKQAQDLSKGAAAISKLTLNPPDFWRLAVSLPSLEEQRRIVARIEELEELIQEAQGLRVKAWEEAASLVSAAVVELFTAHQGEHWCDYRLGDLVNEIRYGISEKAHIEPSGTPVLRMGNIQNGRLDLTDLKYLHLGDRDGEKLLLRPGDVLVNRTNSAELVGKCAVFEEEGEYTFASYLIRLRLDLTKAVPQFVAAYINSPIGRAYMFSERKQMTGQANVNSKTLKAMPISLPPVEEQDRIVAYLGELQAQADELTALQDATQAELDALLPSVLDRAFRGEL